MIEEVEWVEDTEEPEKRKKHKRMKPEPRYKLADLQRMLGIDPRHPDAEAILEQALDSAAWEQWVDEDED